MPVIAGNIGDLVGHTQTRCTADHRLNNAMPHAGADQQGFVVKPRRNKARHQRVDLADIKVQVRESVDRLSGQAVPQLGEGCAVVGLPRALFLRCDVAIDERVRLLHPSGNNPPRSVIFERATHQMHAIGQQSRRDRIAAIPGESLAVEGKVQPFGPVDATARWQTKVLAHAPPSAFS